jgi:iron complex outermembrane receptor protein
MKLKSFFLAFFLLIFFTSNGQSIIKGIIIENIYKSPIDKVEINYDNKSFFSNIDGEFEIKIKSFPSKLIFKDYRYFTKEIELKSSSQNLKIQLTNKGFLLDQIIIKSDINKQKLNSVSVSTSTIKDLNLKKLEGEFIGKSLNEIPGVFVHSASLNTNRITIRGMGSRSPYTSNKIKAFINNIPLSNGVGEISIEDLGLNIFDQIEVSKGPNSSVYGSGLGGSIYMKTKDDMQKENIKILSSVKSYGTYQNSFSFFKKIKKIKTTFEIEKLKSNSYRDNNSYDNLRIFGIINYEINKKISISYLQNNIKLNALIPSSLSYDNYILDPSSAAYSWGKIKGGEEYKKNLSALTFEVHTDKYSSKSSLYFKKYDSDENRPFNYLIEDSKTNGMRHISTIYNDNLIFNLGIDYSMENYNWKTYRFFGTKNQVNINNQEEKRYNFTVFAQGKYSLNNDNTNFQFGISSNKIKYTWDLLNSVIDPLISQKYSYDNIISPRISMTQKIKNQSIFVNISHGYSSPNINETLDENGLVNQDIKPETGWNYEIGLIGTNFNNLISYNISIYYMSIKNLLVAQRTSIDTYVGVNAGKTSHPGIEGELNLLIFQNNDKKITLESNFFKNWYKFIEFKNLGIDFSGNLLTGVPSYTFASNLKFKFNNLTSILSINGVGKTPINDGNTLFNKKYSTINFKLFKTFNIENIKTTISSGINNILNEAYASGIVINAKSFGGNQPRYYYPGIPRNYFISLSINI